MYYNLNLDSLKLFIREILWSCFVRSSNSNEVILIGD